MCRGIWTAALFSAILLPLGCSRSTPDTPVVRALLLLSENKLPEAEAQCTRALRADPNNCQAWLVRGEIRRRRGDAEAALHDYTQVLALDPSNREALYYQRVLKGQAQHATERIATDFRPSVKHWEQANVLVSAPLDLHALPTPEPVRNDEMREGWVSREASVDSYEKGYRSVRNDAGAAGYNRQAHQVAPRPTPYQRWLDAKRRQPKREAPEAFFQPPARPLSDSDQEGSSSALPPRQIVNFGYPFEMPLPDQIVYPVPTTGRRRAWPVESERTRRAQFVGHRFPRRMFSLISHTADSTPPVPYRREDERAVSPGTPSCSDRLDNNNNGYADELDPACWADGMNPSTYTPQGVETDVLNGPWPSHIRGY